MIDFRTSLETKLVEAAQRAERGSRRRIRPRATFATAVVAAACAGAIVLSTTGGTTDTARAALPILAGKPVSLPSDGARFRQLHTAGMDFAKAHPVATLHGTGYVMSSVDGGTVCLAVPDTVDGYGANCAATSRVEREGLVATLMAPSASAGPSEVVVVLPRGVSSATLTTSGGVAQPIAVRDGVAVAAISKDARVAYDAADGQRAFSVRSHEPQGSWALSCKDGRVVPVPSHADTFGAGRARYCGDES
jgi:hypothetical protein